MDVPDKPYPDTREERFPLPVRIVLIALVYFTVAKLSLLLAFKETNASPVWPPTGLALAVLLLWGSKCWPGIALGALIANLVTFLGNGFPLADSLAASLGIAAGNSLEALAGAWLVRRYAEGVHAFSRARDAAMFMLYGAVLATMLSATAGVVSICLGGMASWREASAVWWTWWVGDAAGALVVAPALIVWRECLPEGGKPWTLSGRGGPPVLLAAVAFVVFGVFGGHMPGGVYRVEYLLIPIGVWATFRFSRLGAASFNFYVGLIATLCTVHGLGPFATATVNDSLLLLQTCMAVLVVTTLLLAGVLEERQQDRQALLASEYRYRGLFENSPVSLWEEDFSAVKQRLDELRSTDLAAHLARHPEEVRRLAALVRIINVNQATLVVLDATEKEELTANLEMVFGEGSYAVFCQELLALASGRMVFETETPQRTLRGETIFVSLRLAVVPGHEENWSRVFVALTDITKRRQAEQQLLEHREHLQVLVAARTKDLAEKTEKLEKSEQSLRGLLEDVNATKADLERANEKLQELDRLKSMFIASMSHELRTPLNSIIGFTGILLQGMTGEINSAQRDQLERVYRAGQHLLSLITDVIDISKIESGKILPEPQSFDLAGLVAEACDTVRKQAADKGLSVTARLPEAPLTLFTDRRRLLQCLLNFLSNALKFTEKGGIVLRAEDQDKELLIAVADTGIGIRAEDLPRLFQSFVRLDSHLKTTTPGTGLGLYLTQKLVAELLGGRVAAESQAGKGSTFSLIIPKIIPGGPPA